MLDDILIESGYDWHCLPEEELCAIQEWEPDWAQSYHVSDFFGGARHDRNIEDLQWEIDSISHYL